MDKIILNEYLGGSDDMAVTMVNLRCILIKTEGMSSMFRDVTRSHVQGALTELEALATIMEP